MAYVLLRDFCSDGCGVLTRIQGLLDEDDLEEDEEEKQGPQPMEITPGTCTSTCVCTCTPLSSACARSVLAAEDNGKAEAAPAEEEDPLDAFMSGVQEEVTKLEKLDAEKFQKLRLAPAPGTRSFYSLSADNNTQSRDSIQVHAQIQLVQAQEQVVFTGTVRRFSADASAAAKGAPTASTASGSATSAAAALPAPTRERFYAEDEQEDYEDSDEMPDPEQPKVYYKRVPYHSPLHPHT